MLKNNRPCLLKFVRQKGNYDCGVACLAMIKGIPYYKAHKIVKEVTGKGIHGYTLARKLNADVFVQFVKLQNIKEFKNDKRTLVLTVRDKDIVKMGHFVVKDANDNIYDPMRGVFKIDDYDFYVGVGGYIE